MLDQLVAYGHVNEPIYYAMRFLDGLRADIKIVVSLHRPTTFDAAASLALLQEDVSVAAKGFDSRRESFSSIRPTAKGPHPLPPPPVASNKQAQPILPEETRLCEGVDAKINTLEFKDKCSPSHGKSTKRASQFDLKLTREKTKSNSRAYRLGFRISLRWAYRQALPIL